ncbi:hypothetical protein F4813DRAFT_399253 [Daldinia decipiens]|uniref:uncharacterized protein n=1 Tax=Daldinia decipiens TaxID=326647 RepID=UPI0020C58D08|nr:uncharacterized protein F4813DRAFT_399253 [Daldinia decipiens]KAI1661205.1 hypothetical protein F4813DRAFT_399253 [Daldinia decipiens]
MALPSPETQAKVASEAAQSFVDHFYEALSKRRPLSQFYASASARLTTAGVKPDISINGLLVPDASAYEALLETQGGPVSYDVASFDAQPVNPCFRIGEPEPPAGPGRDATAAAAVRNGDRLSFAVQVSGVVRYGRGHGDGKAGVGDAVAVGGGGVGVGVGGSNNSSKDDNEPLEKPFNEAFLLVPHWEAWGRNAPRGLRKWVIVSQNFRAL